MHIVGGTYLESVSDRRLEMLFGSGFRAAACLSHFGDVIFHSYIGVDMESSFRANAKQFGLEHSDMTVVGRTCLFGYATPLSRPSVRRPSKDLKAGVITVSSEDPILRFGMLEQEAVVCGGKVVYDPQNPDTPLSFWDNGSSAKELVIVANHKEIAKLFGVDYLSGIKKQFKQHPELTCVVRKYGPFGADVYLSDGRCEHIPAYRTGDVFSVGTGDVFSAYFAHFWATCDRDPVVAAGLASRAVAKYVSEAGSIQNVTEDELERLPYRPVVSSRDRIDPIYLAGPFFTLDETMFLQEIKQAFSSMEVPIFSPIDEVGVGEASEVYKGDIDGLRRSSSVFANICGMDVGTIYEIGFARSIGKPVTLFAQDCKPKDLTMLVGGGCKCFSDFTTAVYNAVWDAMENG